MTKVTLLGHAEEREHAVERLHRLGAMQLIDLKRSGLPLENGLPADEIREVSDLLLRVGHVNSILKLSPVKQSWTQKLFGLETDRKAIVHRRTKAALLAETRAFLEMNEETLLEAERVYERALQEWEEFGEYWSVIQLLLAHTIPVEVLRETRRIRFQAGKLPTANLPSFRTELQRGLRGRFHLDARQEGKQTTVVVVVALQEDAETLDALVKRSGLAAFAFRRLPPVERPLAWVEEQLAEAEERIERCRATIAGFQPSLLDQSIFLREELELVKERLEAVNKIKQGKRFFLLQGWVPRSELPLLRRRMRGFGIIEEESCVTPDPGGRHDSDAHVSERVLKMSDAEQSSSPHCSSPPARSVMEPDEPPVRLDNPLWLKPFEMLTELYALPKYRDLDPTFIVAPLFLLYAGFMLTDFIYGLGLVVLGGALFALFRKRDRGVSDISVSIILIGAISMVFGVLTGSYLGDAPKYLLGLETSQLALWRDPLADPLYFLIISLIVGLVHLNIGLVLGLIEAVRKRAWRTLISDRVIWWLLQAAILAFVLKASLLGKLLLIATVILVIAMNGPLGLLGMTGFMGDVISYSRLFALALSTAGIAMTVNLLAEMLSGVPYVGLLCATLIFLIGHLFSFAMNSLGSFVHSIRLQFVEFFGKFYEGGGDTFTPFKEERIYTEISGETEARR